METTNPFPSPRADFVSSPAYRSPSHSPLPAFRGFHGDAAHDQRPQLAPCWPQRRNPATEIIPGPLTLRQWSSNRDTPFCPDISHPRRKHKDWASLEQKSHRFNWLNFESWDAMRTRKARKLTRPDSHLRKPMVTVLYNLGESSGDVSMSKLSSGKTKTPGKACCACCRSVEHNIHQCSEVAKLSKGQL